MLLLAIFLSFVRVFSGHPTPLPEILTPFSRQLLLDHETGLCDCPDTRTLRGIIWTCISTLVHAGWVSVHLNVPPRGTTHFQQAGVRRERFPV